MNAKLIVEGKEFEIEILDPNLEKLLKQKNKTGYERVGKGEYYYSSLYDGDVDYSTDELKFVDDDIYENANYYSDETVAKNNARAEKLMRRLRRFAVEHREDKLNWCNEEQDKFHITYDHEDNTFEIECNQIYQEFGQIYFDTYKTTQLAINTFKDELIWYFTEYKNSL